MAGSGVTATGGIERLHRGFQRLDRLGDGHLAIAAALYFGDVAVSGDHDGAAAEVLAAAALDVGHIARGNCGNGNCDGGYCESDGTDQASCVHIYLQLS